MGAQEDREWEDAGKLICVAQVLQAVCQSLHTEGSRLERNDEEYLLGSLVAAMEGLESSVFGTFRRFVEPTRGGSRQMRGIDQMIIQELEDDDDEVLLYMLFLMKAHALVDSDGSDDSGDLEEESAPPTPNREKSRPDKRSNEGCKHH
ncbi:hypothetical protein FI667_g6119, partial [Globisporangium splendens]